jgi:hypothetical protein
VEAADGPALRSKSAESVPSFFLQRKTHFIAYKSSTLQDPPRLLTEAEVRNIYSYCWQFSMNNGKIFEYCNTMIAVVCTLFPFGCCIQINHYSTSTSFSLFVRMLYVQFQGGGVVK